MERAEQDTPDRASSWGRHAPGALHDLLGDGKRPADASDRQLADVILADEPRVQNVSLVDTDRPRLLVLFERERLEDDAMPTTDTTAQAMLGLMDYVGDRWTGPARTGGDIGSVCAGVSGVQAVLAWLLRPQPPGWKTVRVSPLRAIAALKTVIWAARTRPDAWTGSHVVARDRRTDSGYRVKDGWITIDFPHDGREAWAALCAELGLNDLVETAGDRWWETVGWGDDVDGARPRYEEALRGFDREGASALVRRFGGSSVPFHTPLEVLGHEQTRALGVTLGALPWRVLTEERLDTLAPPVRGDASDLPLDGVRVIDFGVGGVGPFAGSLLGTLGAEVIKIEAPNEFIHAIRPEADGLSTTYSALNVGKQSVQLNLKHADGAERALALVDDTDVVLENFRPGALERIGFGYATLAQRNPELVYVSASGFGSVGPLAALQCTDPHIQAFAGWALANAGPDGTPRRTRYYAMLDLVTSMAIVEATLAGLIQRARTGRGSNVEVSMLEAIIHLHVSRWAGLTEDEQPWNCERLYVPDGIFTTIDGRIALSVEDDQQWAALLRALDEPAELADRVWRTNAGRLAQEAELDAALGAILGQRCSQAWLLALQDTGISVSRVTADDEAALRRDLWARDHLRPLLRRDRDPLRGGGPPWAFDPPLPNRPSPRPGGDEPVFGTARAGMSAPTAVVDRATA
ncbi:MAG: CoA transferase [Solirubrobacteraceae bacterium]